MALRTGMTWLIDELKSLTNATEDHFEEIDLQSILDRNKKTYQDVVLYPTPFNSGGSYIYRDYYIPRDVGSWVELPEDDIVNEHFYLQDYLHNPVLFGIGDTKAVYYQDTHKITFNTDTGGKLAYLTYYVYDMYAAAATLWEKTAALRSNYIDVRMDNHTLALSQTRDFCLDRAKYYRSKSMKDSTTRLVRSDQGVGYGSN